MSFIVDDRTVPRETATNSTTATELQLLSQMVPQIVWLGDADGAWEELNPRWEVFTGRLVTTALGHGWLDAVHPEDREPWRVRWSRAISEGSAVEHDLRLRAADGSWRWMRHRVRPVGPRPGRWLGVLEAIPAPSAGDVQPGLKALEVSEQRFRRLLDTMPQLVWMANERGVVTYYNARAAEFDGIHELPEGTWSWQPVLHPDDTERTTAAWQRALATRTAYVCEHRVRMVDGSYRWHLSRGFPSAGDDGVLTWFGTATDIHELKLAGTAVRESEERYRRSSDALRASEARYRTLFESIDEGFCILQMIFNAQGEAVDYRFVETNAAFERHTGLVDAVGKTARSMVPDLDDSWFQRYGRVATTGEPARFENHAPAMGRWFEVYATRVGDPELRQVALVFNNITERKRTELAMRQTMERYRLVNRATNDVIWDWDLETNRLDWNDAVIQHLGCTPQELGPSIEGWYSRIHPDDADRVIHDVHTAIAEGKEGWSDEYRFRKNDGSYAAFLDRGYIARDVSGKATRMIGSMLDLTARRQVEEALREADRRKDVFLAMLAHELRNPLAPVRNAVQILRRTQLSQPMQEQARDIIDRQVAHMARIIDDLLDVSRISSGKIELRRERMDLVALTMQTAEDYRANLEASGVRLSLHGPGTPVWVDGDHTRLAQLVGNLLHNAGKFTEAGGEVAVHIRADGTDAVVSVVDSGVGMDKALLPRLFDVFSQEDQGLDRSKGGLGLGLALVKGLAQLHGGSVQAHSDGPGHGSTFTVRLPISEGTPAATSAAPLAQASQGLHAVLIEDNADMAASMEMLLSLLGHRVELASDGSSGIATVRAAQPDVVICDIGLPGGTDGYAVARSLRSDPTTSHAFLIALSGYGQSEDKRRSREAGFDLHLVKPVDADALEAVLSDVRRREGRRPGMDGASSNA